MIQHEVEFKQMCLGVSLGKFLGFMVSQRGIEANPDKIQAILNKESLKIIKDVQSLTGQVAVLSKATDKCFLFFKVLRKTFKWMDECQHYHPLAKPI